LKISNEVKVGIIVTAAIAGLVWGINFLKGVDLFSRTTKIFAVYDSVEGLVKSNAVILKGYRIGQVQRLEFLPDKSGRMLATIYINRNVFVSKNSTAQIINSDFFGGKAVNIDLGDDPQPVTDGDTLKGEIISGLSEQIGPIKDKAESLIESLDSVANALHLLLDEKTRRSVSKSFESLANILATFENTASHLDNSLTSEQGKLNIMISNTASITDNLRKNNEKISNILNNFSQISDSLAKANLASTLLNANKVMTETATIMQKINKGEGTLGMLVNNDSLYRNLSTTAADMDKLMIDLKANPKRYVHVSVFGGNKKEK
jgi:phospholipid/cholesterol/gamma-HCH transport system substrate-binding protein